MAQVRFGKHPAKSDYRTLRFKNYLLKSLAPPPAAYSTLPLVYKNLKVSNPAVLFPMDGNDQYGDCTIAALSHAITVYNGLIKKKVIFPSKSAVKLYLQLTGGVDSGLDELNVLNYWQSNSVDGTQILAYVKLDHKNHTHIMQAINLFGGVYLGFQVQQGAQQQFEQGKPWIPGPLTNDGHAVYAVGYDANQLTVLTWGNTQQATWAWWDECVDECYAILPPAAKQAGFAPGFNFAQLQADLKDVAG